MPWLWLIVGGCFEVGFTTSLRFVDGFRNIPWTFAFLASVAVSLPAGHVTQTHPGGRSGGTNFRRSAVRPDVRARRREEAGWG